MAAHPGINTGAQPNIHLTESGRVDACGLTARQKRVNSNRALVMP